MRRIRLTRADGLFFLLFAAALALALWKVPYGFGWYDEAFYLTIPHRLTLGDALFLDEWHLSQMSGLLLTPFVALYRGLFQCNDGILLAARHFYVALHGLVALFVYLRLRRFGAASVFAAVSFFLFTPFDIMVYSYNTMAIDLLTLCCVGLATMRPGNRPALLLSGAAFAGSVLCCPYLAFVYFLYAALAAVRGIFRRRRRAVPAADGVSGDGAFLLSAKAFFFLTLGIALPAALFLLFVFSRASLSELLRVFPALFTDPEHADLSLLSKLSQYLRHCQPYYRYGFAAYGLLLLALLLDKNRMRRRGLYLAGSCAVAAHCWLWCCGDLINTHYNAINMPLAFVGLSAYLLCRKKPKRLFFALFLPGLAYTFAVCMSSNVGFYAVSMAYAVPNLASFLFLGRLLGELNAERAASSQDPAPRRLLRSLGLLAGCAAVAVLLALQVIVKARHCFFEESPERLTCRISAGPARGLYTSPANGQGYDRLYADLQDYRDRPRDNILLLTEKTWCYLTLEDFPYGTYSAWLSGINQGVVDTERLLLYYRLNPDKIPRYIYVPKGSSFDRDTLQMAAERYGYRFEESAVSCRLTRE